MDQDNVADIVVRYGLDGLGIESQWEQSMPHLFRPVLEPTKPSVYGTPDFFPWGKAAGVWIRLPPSSTVEIKERTELYFYSPSVSLWLVTG